MTTGKPETTGTPVATVNPCRLCAPLGASLAFKGIEGSMVLLHGSQGCSTYIRRFLIGHFREPVDIASSGFSEATTIFGGGDNLVIAVANIVQQYSPKLIGIATTCLAETIGENVGLHLRRCSEILNCPPIVTVSCPSYAGSHTDGFRTTVREIVAALAQRGMERRHAVTVFPGMVSCAELRYLRSMVDAFKIGCIMLPDYSETLDGGVWDNYRCIPEGGTTVEECIACGSSVASLEVGSGIDDTVSAGKLLEQQCDVPLYRCALPIGIDGCDAFMNLLAEISGERIPATTEKLRRKLVDMYIDGHKFVAGKRVAIYGSRDRVTALAVFCTEIGMRISHVMCGESGDGFAEELAKLIPGGLATENILGDADFGMLATILRDDPPDLLLGSSKGYPIARELNIPLIRTEFPVHDRIGGQRIMHIGYEGTMNLFETVVNVCIECSQDGSQFGYMTW